MQKQHIWLDEQSELIYFPNFIIKKEAHSFFEKLRVELSWQAEKIRIFGKEHWQPRLLAWYADQGVQYSYSGITHYPQHWSEYLSQIREMVEAETATVFNSVLANLYRYGADSMGWHSDDEKELGPEPLIASLSLGSERRFLFRPRKGIIADKKEFLLQSGSLLLMRGRTQEHFQHAIPKTAKAVGERINLTFRKIII
jgi:alkylated DNA repair dioxygenase AlkB